MANGVPALLGKIANVTNTASLVFSDVQNVLGLFAGPQWGIAIDGVFQIVPDSIISVDFKRDWQIPNYPQEAGAFQAYNKVATPFDARVRMTKGGTAADREAFLSAVDSLASSLDLYDVVMPEKTFENANIVHYDFRRTSTNGVGLLTVDLWLLEVRIAPSAAFTNTAAPSGADPINGGAVQTQTPTTDQSAAASLFK